MLVGTKLAKAQRLVMEFTCIRWPEPWAPGAIWPRARLRKALRKVCARGCARFVFFAQGLCARIAQGLPSDNPLPAQGFSSGWTPYQRSGAQGLSPPDLKVQHSPQGHTRPHAPAALFLLTSPHPLFRSLPSSRQVSFSEIGWNFMAECWTKQSVNAPHGLLSSQV